ncbi:Probable molybdopterin binding domain protein [Acididesulfobacillus acetoxydans]|uniref:Molybdopterin molybdenumtransferase n=1 Tax=Acididesulfobacillus acetoxydans TaxID=1561005 RepID=A0A8S0Y3B0_9FIRM|nr:molybdopterin-binding protein [Acididesulfobacillus acetoxydans]CAA7601895.1 Probable molybdopterin binding domain protein [Acididesulfobacillus acetoxydans]CEJ08261.1 Molybdopterin biosynthesis enzyme [Acididesulfobacillus acetoxydans]
MQKIRVEDAVGSVLLHDLTQILPGESKGPRFKKGHIVREEDIPVLLSMGKENLYVWDRTEGLVHENEAAERLARAVTGPGLHLSEPSEGKITLTAEYSGLLYVAEEAVYDLNSLEYIVLATLHSHRPVEKGAKVAGTRVVPLMIEENILAEAERVAQSHNGPILEVKALRSWKVGVVTTGSEVYHGRIKDKFGPVVRAKIEGWGSTVIGQSFADDDIPMIQGRIREHLDKGAEMVLVTGGMSVDPDDVTPTAIRELGGELVTYGSPVLPGAMFLLAYLGDIPIMGLPGCVMYSKTTVFDLVAPRVLAGEHLTKRDIAKLGHGGLCLECKVCTYPHCPFGK